jgi:hypothetical protein
VRYRTGLISSLLVGALVCAALLYLNISQNEVAYKFAVAGHTYGKPGSKTLGLHPPFVEDFDYIKYLEKLAFVVFTGDIVYNSRAAAWDVVDEQIASLGLPVHFAPGNHDRPHNRLYLERYGVEGKSWHSFTHGGDLFILLDGNAEGWSIAGEQLAFLSESLRTVQRNSNVFIFKSFNFHKMAC